MRDDTDTSASSQAARIRRSSWQSSDCSNRVLNFAGNSYSCRSRFQPEAEIDLNEIWDFIAEDSIDAADRVRDNIFAIQELAQTPNQGHRRSDLTSCPLRFWRVYDYLVVYAPEERP